MLCVCARVESPLKYTMSVSAAQQAVQVAGTCCVEANSPLRAPGVYFRPLPKPCPVLHRLVDLCPKISEHTSLVDRNDDSSNGVMLWLMTMFPTGPEQRGIRVPQQQGRRPSGYERDQGYLREAQADARHPPRRAGECVFHHHHGDGTCIMHSRH